MTGVVRSRFHQLSPKPWQVFLAAPSSLPPEFIATPNLFAIIAAFVLLAQFVPQGTSDHIEVSLMQGRPRRMVQLLRLLQIGPRGHRQVKVRRWPFCSRVEKVSYTMSTKQLHPTSRGVLHLCEATWRWVVCQWAAAQWRDQGLNMSHEWRTHQRIADCNSASSRFACTARFPDAATCF